MAREKFTDLLIREQFRGIVAQLPRLYALFVAVIFFVVLLLLPAASPKVLGPWAILVTAFVVMRAVYWRKVGRRIDSFSVEKMRAKLEQIDKIGVAVFVYFASAGLITLQTPDLVLQTVTMFAIWSTALGSAFYLSVSPRCTRDIVWGVSGCVCAVFVWSGNVTLLIVSPLLLLASYALTVQLRRNFESFRAAIEDRHTIEVLRSEALSLAMTDPLTRLPNRRSFEDRLAIIASDNCPFALAAIDLDGFKPVNDAYGHGAGDKALILVAERLGALGPKVFAARLGGDEFVLLIEGADAADALAQRAMDKLCEPYEIDGVVIRMGASCGLAYWRLPGDEKDLLERADAALYSAKSRPERNFAPSGRTAVIKSAA